MDHASDNRLALSTARITQLAPIGADLRDDATGGAGPNRERAGKAMKISHSLATPGTVRRVLTALPVSESA